MNDDIRDEVPVPHFENELWQTLAAAHGDQHGTVLPPLRDVRPHGNRRRRRMLVASVGSIAAAAALVAAVVAVGSGTDDPPEAETAQTAPPAETLADRIAGALGPDQLDYVFRDVQNDAQGFSSESYYDLQSGASRFTQRQKDGDLALDTGPATAPGVDDVGPERPENGYPFWMDPEWPRTTQRMVDYCWETYTESDEPAMPRGNWLNLIAERLENGELLEDGTEVINGKELIRLVEVPYSQLHPDPPSGDEIVAYDPETGESWTADQMAAGEGPEAVTTSTMPAGTTEPTTPTTEPAGTTVPTTEPAGTTVPTTEPADTGPTTTTTISIEDIDWDEVSSITYIDPDTYLPVMTTGYPGSDSGYTKTYEFLPRTPENLALLSPPIPAGFTLTTESHGDGETADRCGW